MKNNFQICGLCKREINLDKDNYVHMIDYKEGKFFSEGWYHTICYNENIHNYKKRMGKYTQLLDKASNILGIKKEEKVYEIPKQ